LGTRKEGHQIANFWWFAPIESVQHRGDVCIAIAGPKMADGICQTFALAGFKIKAIIAVYKMIPPR